MAEIKDTSRVAAKWARVTPERTTDYLDGVNQPRRDWARAASGAQETHAAAMVKAAASKSYARGVNAAGTAKWQTRAVAKGPGRFQEGVRIAESDYMRGFEPYAAVIKGVALPPRYPKGDPRNLERVRAIAIALSTRRASAAV